MIRITDKLFIAVDSNNYTLMIKTGRFTKKGEEINLTIGYFGSLENALNAAADYISKQKLSEGECSLKEAVDVIRGDKIMIQKLIKGE